MIAKETSPLETPLDETEGNPSGESTSHASEAGGGDDVPVQVVTEIPLPAALGGQGDAVLAQAATEPPSPIVTLPAEVAHFLSIGGWIALLMCLVMIVRRLNWINNTVGDISDSADAQRAEIGDKFGGIEHSIRMLFGNVDMKQQKTPINQTGTAQGCPPPDTAAITSPVTPPELEASAANGLSVTQPTSIVAPEDSPVAAPEHSPQNRYSHEAGINELVDIERLTRGCKRQLEASAKTFSDFAGHMIELKDELEGIAEQVMGQSENPTNDPSSEGSREIITSWATSLDRLLRQWKNQFADYEIHDISPAAGDDYDPKLFDIIPDGAVATNDRQLDQKIQSLVKKGYRLESATLRRAQVKIWKYTPGAQNAPRTTYEQRTQALHASAKRTSYTSFNNNRI